MKKVDNNILFSIVIPMYNGEKYIDNVMHSLINEKVLLEDFFDFIEIIIINDGSSDNGSKKAKVWEEEWNKKIRKDFIRVIDKENGQYGSVINCALKIVNGKYIKVLDVDDIFNTKNFIDIIDIIYGININVDIILTDFIFDKVLENKQIIYRWTKYFEPYKVLKMKDQTFPNSIITMHSIIYRTEFLRSINYEQVEGIFYSDSQYATIPFAQAKLMYYISIPLYRYYIGHKDQSININMMVRNRKHQEKVMRTIIDELFTIEFNSKAQKKYAWRIAKNMFEWQSMIISHDKSLNDRNKLIYNNLINLLKECKENNDSFAYNVVNRGALSRVTKFTKGNGIVSIIKFGERLYARFKLNIMANWTEEKKKDKKVKN